MKLGCVGRVTICIQGTPLAVQDGARSGKRRVQGGSQRPLLPTPLVQGGTPRSLRSPNSDLAL